MTNMFKDCVDQVPERTRQVVATDAMVLEVWETEVFSDTAGYTIYLPPVAEAKGLTYTFNSDGTGTLTITRNAGNDTLFTTASLAASGEVVLYSDGQNWIVVSETT